MDSTLQRDDRSLIRLLVGDGRPLLALFAVGLVLAGGFAWFLSAAGETLPHELRFLGIGMEELRAMAGGRVADFMTHDRVAFGGTLIAMGVLYGWLISGPLEQGEGWAWGLIAATGSFGFASFVAYAGTGYIDAWHLTASGALLITFVPGLLLTRKHLGLRRPLVRWPAATAGEVIGRRLLALTGVGLACAGTTILALGSIVVFVPQDLIFIGFDRATLDALNPHLVPLIAHDRIGFGGGVATMGMLVLGCVRWATWSRALWQALAVSGAVGFGAAIGIHGLVGYLDASHVGPAVGGAVLFAIGMAFSRPAGVPSTPRSSEA